MKQGLILALFVVSAVSCAPTKKEIPHLGRGLDRPLSADESRTLLKEVGKNWAYGQGVGETAATIGTIAVFPPFALVVVGNSALGLAGYEPVRMRDFLPEDAGQVWDGGYSLVTGAPGRTIAAISHEEYRDRELAESHLNKVLSKEQPQEELKKAQLNLTSESFKEKDNR